MALSFLTSIKHSRIKRKNVEAQHLAIDALMYSLLYNIYFDCYVSATGSSVAKKKIIFSFATISHPNESHSNDIHIFEFSSLVTNLECEFN